MNAIDQECAAVDFEPWPPAQPGDTEIDLSDEAFRTMGITVRRALKMMARSKAELVSNCQTTPFDHLERTMKSFDTTAGELRRLADMLDGAYARMLVAAEANLVDGGRFID